jgi:hypothetical protein
MNECCKRCGKECNKNLLINGLCEICIRKIKSTNKDKRLQTLQEMYKIRASKQKEKKVCSICGGTGIDRRTYPAQSCSHSYLDENDKFI